jgi:hypothetical protein
MAALHLVRAILDTAPEITGTDDQTHLHTHIGTGLNGFANGIDNVKIQAAMGSACQGFTADLQQDSFVLDLIQVDSLLLTYLILSYFITGQAN